MHREFCCIILLFVPSTDAASRPSLKPYAPVKSMLLEYYQSKLAYELYQMDIHWPSEFESRQMLELRGELEACRDLYGHLRLESSEITDYIELKQVNPDHGDRFKQPGTHQNAKGSPIACAFSNGFVGCYFRNETYSNNANLFFLTVHKHEYTHRHEAYELTGHTRTLYTLRRMSDKPTWKLHVCRDDAYQCSVSIRLVQIASLDAFEAQLNRLDGMIEDIEDETVRLLELKDHEDKDNDRQPWTGANKDHIPLRPYEFADSAPVNAYKEPLSEEYDADLDHEESQEEPVEEDGYRDEL